MTKDAHLIKEHFDLVNVISYSDLNRENKQLMSSANDYFKTTLNATVNNDVADVISTIIYDWTSADATDAFEKYVKKQSLRVYESLLKLDFCEYFSDGQKKV